MEKNNNTGIIVYYSRNVFRAVEPYLYEKFHAYIKQTKINNRKYELLVYVSARQSNKVKEYLYNFPYFIKGQ